MPRLTPYLSLITAFLDHAITVGEFEERYLTMYKKDPTDWNEQEFQFLESIFYAVDAYCADPALRHERDLDEEGLRKYCRQELRNSAENDLLASQEDLT